MVYICYLILEVVQVYYPIADRFMLHCVISACKHARVCNCRLSIVHSAFFNENAHVTPTIFILLHAQHILTM